VAAVELASLGRPAVAPTLKNGKEPLIYTDKHGWLNEASTFIRVNPWLKVHTDRVAGVELASPQWSIIWELAEARLPATP
jgi:hypothetical protein